LAFAVEILATTTETFKQITSKRLGQTWKQEERSYQEKMGFTLLKPLRDLHNKQPSGKSLSCFLAFSRLTRDMIALRWQLLLLLLVGTTGDEISVVVSKKVFEKRFQGHSYDKWRDFVKAAGEQDNPGGEARLKAGFTLLFAASATVTVGTIIHYVIGKEFAAPCTAWVVILILLMYAAAVFVYCMATYADPAQRVVTNLLFGLVPWCVSCASYLVAVQLVDACRGLRNMTHEPIAEAPEPEPPQSIAWLTGGRRSSSVQDLQLSLEDFSCDLRFGLLLAVLPSLGISIWFTRSYATGFTGVGTFFDVLALCLFVDVWRLVMHTSLLLAPSWTFPKRLSQDNADVPGLFKLTFLLCVAWLVALVLMKRHATGVGFTDPIKIHVLACLASYVFFFVSLVLAMHYNAAIFKERLNFQPNALTATFLCMVWAIAACMLLTATIFNATEPNTIGILAMVASILHAASTFSDSVPGCIAMMVASTVMTSMFVLFSVHYAAEVRDAIG
jgi:hypothetical protein